MDQRIYAGDVAAIEQRIEAHARLVWRLGRILAGEDEVDPVILRGALEGQAVPIPATAVGATASDERVSISPCPPSDADSAEP